MDLVISIVTGGPIVSVLIYISSVYMNWKTEIVSSRRNSLEE